MLHSGSAEGSGGLGRRAWEGMVVINGVRQSCVSGGLQATSGP